MKYRKKPIVVDAFQLGIDCMPSWFKEKLELGEVILHRIPFEESRAKNYGQAFCEIKTLEGIMQARESDYIIKGINGELYPCKPDIFEKTYEPEVVDDALQEMRYLIPEENEKKRNMYRRMAKSIYHENFNDKVNNMFKLIKGYSLNELAAYFALKHPSSPCYLCEYDAGLFCTKETCSSKHKIDLYKKFLEQEELHND